ncbi:MAG: hypothetical protein R2713_04970 [Ilumatobacteraceae bacterium]
MSTTIGVTPHDSAMVRTVAGSGDSPISAGVGRKRAIARVVRPERVQHKMASAPASTARDRRHG